MAKPPRDAATWDSRTYFLTARTWQGRALFQAQRTATLFLDVLYEYRAQAKFQLHEFVVMPNHVHLMITPGPDVTLERAMQLIKGGFSHRAGQELGRMEIWQRGYVDHRIRDAQDYARHRRYIHMNPVRARLVDAPGEFPFSSAVGQFELDPAPQGLKPPE